MNNMALILSFLALIPRALLGFCAAHWIWNSSGNKHLLLKVCLAVPLGVGLSSLASFLWIWIGFPLSAYTFVELGVVALLTLYTAGTDRKTFLQILRNKIALSGSEKAWLLLAVLGLAVFAGGFYIAGWQNPHGLVDAWTNWNVAARFIYRGGEFWQATFLREFDHPDYPLLLSMSNAATWTLIGKDYIRAPMLLGFLFAGSTLGLLFGILNILKGGAQASLAMLILAAQPGITYQAMSQMADSPEAMYFLASAGLIPVFFLVRDRRIAVLAGILAGLSAWTKNEGLTFVLASCLVWALIAVFHEKKSFGSFVLGLAFPAAVILLFQVFLAPANDLFLIERDVSALAQDLQRYKLIVSSAGRALLNFGGGIIGVPILMFIYALLAGRSARPAAGLWPVLMLISIQLVIYFAVYVVTPYDLIWHLNTSLGRLYVHVFPVCVLCLFAWLAPPEELAGKW
jgi:hypothetical protein